MEQAFAEQKIREITDKIVRGYQPEKIVLFGSWAWGTPHQDSDVDLLIIKEGDTSRIEREREVRALLFLCGVPLDILVYAPRELERSINNNRNLFLEDIVRNGRILYSKPNIQINLTHEPAELVA